MVFVAQTLVRANLRTRAAHIRAGEEAPRFKARRRRGGRGVAVAVDGLVVRQADEEAPAADFIRRARPVTAALHIFGQQAVSCAEDAFVVGTPLGGRRFCPTVEAYYQLASRRVVPCIEIKVTCLRTVAPTPRSGRVDAAGRSP